MQVCVVYILAKSMPFPTVLGQVCGAKIVRFLKYKCICQTFEGASNLLFVFLSFCRHVIVPKDMAKIIAAKKDLMAEKEWRAMGIQQSQGWIHYMYHKPGTSIFHSYEF